MPTLGLERQIIDPGVYQSSVRRFRDDGIVLPRFSQLADPRKIPENIRARLGEIDPDAPHPLNLFRVNWYNPDQDTTFRSTPEFIELPASLTGVEARIVVLPADTFPMIHTHKVLASYGCLVPRILTGQFDPQTHRAVWPSTGNYCRGGVAVSRIMDCRGVAVLPEGMSRERFEWLEQWVSDPDDIIKTPGTESNVKEIYDKCADLDQDAHNIIFNQFSEFGNYLIHYLCTGKAIEDVFDHYQTEHNQMRLSAFVSATGSGGTLAAGDFLKPRHRSWNVAVEALECPTLLYNGFGEHNIQGIGDKHVPLIHNVMGTDAVVAVSDQATDELFVLFNSDEGRDYLTTRRGVPEETVVSLRRFGFSSICNILAAIKIAKYRHLGTDDLIVTVATDGAELYGSESAKIVETRLGGRFDTISAAEVFGEHLLGCKTDHLLELTQIDRQRMFNLGYFTWVEQQGISVDDFSARRDESFWLRLQEWIPVWDQMIEEFNTQTGAADRL
jgi:cysteine synthase